jgi:hypothetical protein
LEIGLDDSSRIMVKLLEIHEDVQAIRALLEEDDDGEEDDDSGS